MQTFVFDYKQITRKNTYAQNEEVKVTHQNYKLRTAQIQ